MKYGNKLILIFLIFSTFSMAYMDDEEMEKLIGKVNMSEHGIPIGENSKVLDNYKLKNIPIFDKRKNIDNEMKKIREETEKRKEDYDSDTHRINEIDDKLREIEAFFTHKEYIEKKLILYKKSNNELKDIRKKVESELEKNPQLFKKAKEYREKLGNIASYVYDEKHMKESDIENVEFTNVSVDDDNEWESNLNKNKIKSLLNDEDVWKKLELDNEGNLRTFLKDCALVGRWMMDEYYIVDYSKKPSEYVREGWRLEKSFYIDKAIKKILDAKGMGNNKVYKLYERFGEINKNLSNELKKDSRNQPKFKYNSYESYPDKPNVNEDILEYAIKEYEPKKKEYDIKASSKEKEEKDITTEKEEIEKRIKETASSDNLAYGTNAIAVGIRSYAIGTNALTVGIDSVTLGSNSATFGNGSNSIGERNYTKGVKDQVFGVENITVGKNNVLHGNHNMVYGETNTVLGNNNNLGKIIPTYAEWKKIDGNASKSEDEYKTYLNSEYKYNEWQSKNSGKTLRDFINQGYVKNNVILGSNITNTDVNNAVVIGNGSKAIENAVSIGNVGTTRQIKYVKAGTDDTDAVNVKQLKDYVAANSKGLENINAKSNLALSGVANAIAMSSMTQPREGLLNITGAYGTYGGEHALAVGISGNTERFSYKLGVSTNMRGNVGVGLGFGMTVVSSTKDDVIKRMEKKILEYMKESKEQNEKIKELENEMKELRKLIKKN